MLKEPTQRSERVLQHSRAGKSQYNSVRGDS